MVHPLILWLAICAIAAVSYRFLPDLTLFPSLVSPLLLSGLFFLWLIWQGWCAWTNRQKLYSAAAITKLADSGPYAVVRHPIYLANLIAIFFAVLYYAKLWFVVSAAFAAVMLVLWAKWEEKILLARFGTAYKTYMASVPCMNPFPAILLRRRRRVMGSGLYF